MVKLGLLFMAQLLICSLIFCRYTVILCLKVSPVIESKRQSPFLKCNITRASFSVKNRNHPSSKNARNPDVVHVHIWQKDLHFISKPEAIFQSTPCHVPVQTLSMLRWKLYRSDRIMKLELSLYRCSTCVDLYYKNKYIYICKYF